MGVLLTLCAEIEISNNTQNITLNNPRTFFRRGGITERPLPELSPGSSKTRQFWGHPKLWSIAGTTWVSGILVYEADPFTLAIYFYNPIDRNQSSMELGLELSPDKAHLGDLEATYTRMAHGIYSNSCQDIKFTRIMVGKTYGTARLSHGPIKVTATVFNSMTSRIEVVLEEQRGSGEEGWGDNPWDVRGDRSRRNEETGSRDSKQDSFQDLK